MDILTEQPKQIPEQWERVQPLWMAKIPYCQHDCVFCHRQDGEDRGAGFKCAITALATSDLQPCLPAVQILTQTVLDCAGTGDLNTRVWNWIRAGGDLLLVHTKLHIDMKEEPERCRECNTVLSWEDERFSNYGMCKDCNILYEESNKAIEVLAKRNKELTERVAYLETWIKDYARNAGLYFDIA